MPSSDPIVATFNSPSSDSRAQALTVPGSEAPDIFSHLRNWNDASGVGRRQALLSMLKSIPMVSAIGPAVSTNTGGNAPIRSGLDDLAAAPASVQAEAVAPPARGPVGQGEAEPVEEASLPPMAPARAASTPEPKEMRALGANAPYNVPTEIQAYIRSVAPSYGLDTEPVMRLAHAEGGGYNNVSPAGARGPMQLMPSTAREMGVRDIGNWRENVDGGLRYLKQQVEAFGGNYKAAAAAYNAGPNNPGVRLYAATGNPAQLPAETKAYILKIFGAF